MRTSEKQQHSGETPKKDNQLKNSIKLNTRHKKLMSLKNDDNDNEESI